jgi:hypothetical protein
LVSVVAVDPCKINCQFGEDGKLEKEGKLILL